MFPIEWREDRVRILDQTRLPQEEVYLELTTPEGVALAIMELKVRGAPAIGVAAAYGMALGARKIRAKTAEEFQAKLQPVKETLAKTRPTARNLFWALERMEKVAQSGTEVSQIQAALVNEAVKIHREAREADDKLSSLGAELIPEGATVLTHCNTGVLATGGYGTALGVIKKAWEAGKKIRVLATETRPLLQGARLTCWELQKARIPATLITDSMAGYFLSQGKLNVVIVGADRIAANGDTANKIGTYTLAVLAKENNVPFYVAAPTTTIDPEVPSGAQIPIEERSPREVTHFQGVCCTPEGVQVANPAFDVTPHRYITAIITEKGILKKPFGEGIGRVLSGETPAETGNVLRLF
ncbi:MAG: S-methyl-5-thioribose-1-phosphate isomerase [Chloroflexota bacterium]